MELKHIKELMTAMVRNGLKRVSLKNKEGFELLLEREENGTIALPPSFVELQKQSQSIQNRADAALSHASEADTPKALFNDARDAEPVLKQEVPGVYVNSPMVGTFYVSPSPDEPPFIKPGDKVEKDTIVCIIEAMKVMNEIKSGVSGTVAEVCIETGHPVEFGTKLFRIV